MSDGESGSCNGITIIISLAISLGNAFKNAVFKREVEMGPHKFSKMKLIFKPSLDISEW